MMSTRLFSVLSVVVLAFLAVGCGPKMDPYKVTLTANDSIKDSSVAVHVIGINKNDFPLWDSYSMSKYWSPADTLHKNPAVATTILFDAKNLRTQAIAIDDAHWKMWRDYGATHLFILANLPGFKEDRPGNADARRQISAIDNLVYEDGFWGIKEVQLDVTHDGIRLCTPLKQKN